MSWVVSTILILIKGDIIHLTSIPIDIDFVVIILVYLLAYRGERGAGIFTLGQGLLTDIFTGGIWGLQTMLYIIIYLFIKILSNPFDLTSIFGQFTLISMSVLLKEVLMVLLLHMFSLNIDFSYLNFLLFIISALFSGLIAPFFFYLLNSLGRFINRAKEEF